MSKFKLASLEEIDAANSIPIGPELAALTARYSSLLKIQFDLVGDPIDDNTSALWRELYEKGVFDLDPPALMDYFIRETGAIRARVDELATLLGIDN